jgi:hypothetical protein
VKPAAVLPWALLIVACAGAPATMPVSSTEDMPGEDGAALDAKLVRQGYRIERRGERVLYCRTQSTTGTAFSNTVCLTSEQLREQQRNLQQSQDTLTQPRGVTCAGKVCTGG